MRAEGSVELWLMRLLQEAQRSLHSIIRLASQAISHADVNMMDFFGAFPSQVLFSFLFFSWISPNFTSLNQSCFPWASKFIDSIESVSDRVQLCLTGIENVLRVVFTGFFVHFGLYLGSTGFEHVSFYFRNYC